MDQVFNDPRSRDRLLARYYDLEYRDFTEDINFYIQYASVMDPLQELPILELGCGTGRVLVPLAEAGFKVVGVDASPGMLRLCEERVRAADVSHHITLVWGDMRDLVGVPRGPFNMAFCSLNTFAYLTSTDEQLAMLRAVHSRLVEHGLLILDLTPPWPHLLPPGDGEVLYQGWFCDHEANATVHKLVTGVSDPATQTHEVTMFYDVVAPDGGVSRLTNQLKLRWTGRYEMELLLKMCDYRVEKVYGSYELDEFDEGSERMIFVART
jgi:SAM-dependent methyltransferase